jgi:hypothetical protein
MANNEGSKRREEGEPLMNANETLMAVNEEH